MVKTKDLKVYRGDKISADDLYVEVAGDHTARNLSFAVKADKELTSDRLIEKTIELTAVYSGGKTKIGIPLDAVDTQDLAEKKYYYDLTSTSPADATDVITVSKGKFDVEGDVQTPYDGTDLPGDAQRYIPYLPVDPETHIMSVHPTVRNLDLEESTLEEVKEFLMTLVDDLKARNLL